MAGKRKAERGCEMTNKKELFPAAFEDEGGVQPSHIPTQKEMQRCAYVKRVGVVCPRKEGKREMVVGGPMELVNCRTCSYHPWHTAVKKMFIASKGSKE